jgi:hypothetical protein
MPVIPGKLPMAAQAGDLRSLFLTRSPIEDFVFVGDDVGNGIIDNSGDSYATKKIIYRIYLA